MRIIIIHSDFDKQHINRQPWNFSYKMACGLSNLGHKVILITDSFCKSLDNIEIKRVKKDQLRFKINELNDFLNEADVCVYFGNSLSGLYLKYLKNCYTPIILHIGSMHYTFSELKILNMKELRYHWLHLLFSIPPISYVLRLLNNPLISKIFVTNNILKKRLIKFGVNKEKIYTIPLVFDIKSFYKNLNYENIKDINQIRKLLALPPEYFIITYLGSPLTIRGTDILIKAAKLLKNKINKFLLLILSRLDSSLAKKEDEYLRFLIKKFKLSDKIKIISYKLDPEKIKHYILASDVITLPFKIVQNEPPLSILEAMALAKPVLTTNTCGLSDIISEERGLLIKPGDFKDLALNLYKLKQNPEKKLKIGNRAKEFVLNLPDWNVLTHWMEKKFYEII